MEGLNGKFEVLGSSTRPQENSSGGNQHIRDMSQETHPDRACTVPLPIRQPVSLTTTKVMRKRQSRSAS